MTGELLVLRPGASVLEVLLPAGTLGSPQGLVVTPDGTALIVADYSSGLWRVDRATGAATRLAQPAIDSLIGVDGLTTDGRFLYGFQNGVAPQRVLKFALDAGWTSILNVTVLAANLPVISEPTTGLVRNRELVFVSRSQWSDFGGDGAQTTAAPAPAIIARLPLD
jgi:sugar lactone lactonase YvrE